MSFYVQYSFTCLRYSVGVMWKCFLKATLKALISAKPQLLAIRSNCLIGASQTKVLPLLVSNAIHSQQRKYPFARLKN